MSSAEKRLTSDELWAHTRVYVERVVPGLSQAKFDRACVGVYEAMRFLVKKPKRERHAR